jgi:hypothetical protein
MRGICQQQQNWGRIRPANPRNDLREVAQRKDRRKSGGLPNKKFEVLHQNQNNTKYQDYSRTERFRPRLI